MGQTKRHNFSMFLNLIVAQIYRATWPKKEWTTKRQMFRFYIIIIIIIIKFISTSVCSFRPLKPDCLA